MAITIFYQDEVDSNQSNDIELKVLSTMLSEENEVPRFEYGIDFNELPLKDQHTLIRLLRTLPRALVEMRRITFGRGESVHIFLSDKAKHLKI
jgi:hypothetical protein